MAIPQQEHYHHWNYFLALEQDLIKISRFVELNKDNYQTYSMELAHLLFAASSEVEVVLKSLCKLVKSHDEATPAKLKNCLSIIRNNLDEFIDDECRIHRYGLILTPWVNWRGDDYKEPDWWKAYSKVKHYRNSYFSEANLKNALNSMAALCIANLYYHYFLFSKSDAPSFSQAIINLGKEPELISFNDRYYKDLNYGPKR